MNYFICDQKIEAYHLNDHGYKLAWDQIPPMNSGNSGGNLKYYKMGDNLQKLGHGNSEDHDGGIKLIVNGTQKNWREKTISFKDLIILAYGTYDDRPTMTYTVAYEDGPKENPEGSMVKDTIVYVKNKMIFHATSTDRS